MRGAWSEDEHRRFLEAMDKFPKGPWKAIAEYIGTRSVRQAQTHAQQHHEKIARQLLGFRRDKLANKTTVKPTPLVCRDIVSRWRALEAQRETDGVLMQQSSKTSSKSSSPVSSAQGSPTREADCSNDLSAASTAAV